jgi:mono/diheme cytochrome c family protein
MRLVYAYALTAALAACTWDLNRMNDQPRCESGETTFSATLGSCDREPPPGTEARGAADDRNDAAYVHPPTRAQIERGADRFARFCATCHGPLGDGDSQVAENMLRRRPPSLHEPRIVALPDLRIAEIIRDGYGLMPAYRHELGPADRRAITVYLRVLERSQDVRLDALPTSLQAEARRWLFP